MGANAEPAGRRPRRGGVTDVCEDLFQCYCVLESQPLSTECFLEQFMIAFVPSKK